MYLDVWRSGTFILYSCKAAFWTQEISSRLSDVKCSVVLRSVFAINSALTYLQVFRECATPPHIQVRHCTWLSFTRPSPGLVLQATNAGVRRPGYEAMFLLSEPAATCLPPFLPVQTYTNRCSYSGCKKREVLSHDQFEYHLLRQ